MSKEKSKDLPWKDGNPALDRPLFVQFCANKPDDLLDAAQYVAPYCDAVDLNLGCPQGIARSGHYGAFLQEDWNTIYKIINKLHNELSVPVTAKMRILETKKRTLEYAQMILSAGASVLTVHGRRREQKGHNTGLADWSTIRYLRDNLPPETVLFANGNILNSGDLDACLAATGVDGIMSAEGNLSDPTIFAEPPKKHNEREYWYGRNGKGGYRMDAVLRRYLDIIYRYSLDKEPPTRKPLYIPGDPTESFEVTENFFKDSPSDKKRKRGDKGKLDPSMKSMQGHLFQLLRPLVTVHTDIRDVLARIRPGDIEGFERVLSMVEEAVKKGLDDHSTSSEQSTLEIQHRSGGDATNEANMTPKQKTGLKYSRPWFVCQPYIRPLPEEAIMSGAMKISKKEAARVQSIEKAVDKNEPIKRTVEFHDLDQYQDQTSKELPQPGLVCG